MCLPTCRRGPDRCQPRAVFQAPWVREPIHERVSDLFTISCATASPAIVTIALSGRLWRWCATCDAWFLVRACLYDRLRDRLSRCRPAYPARGSSWPRSAAYRSPTSWRLWKRSTYARPRSPSAARRDSSRRRSSTAWARATASPADTHTPHPTRWTSRHNSESGSTDATTGLPAAIIEYTLDGTELVARPGFSST